MKVNKLTTVVERIENAFPWDSLPNEMKAMILERMDLETRLTFRRTGPSQAVTAKSYPKVQVHIEIIHWRKGYMIIKLFEGFDLDPSMTWTVRRIRAKRCIVTQASSTGKVLSRYEFDKTLSSTTFQTAGRLIRDPMFNIKVLYLELGYYNGFLDFGLKAALIEKLVLHRCYRKSVIKSIFLDYNCVYEFIDFDDETQNKCKVDFVRVMTESVQAQWNFIHCVEDAYTKAFPEQYQVESLTDATQRCKLFYDGCEATGFNFFDSRWKKVDWIVTGLMYLRAAFGSDPVTFLSDECPETYNKKIASLRTGVRKYKLTSGLIALLSVIYVARNCSCLACFDGRQKLFYASLRARFDNLRSVVGYNLFDEYVKMIEKHAVDMFSANMS